MDNDFKHYINV